MTSARLGLAGALVGLVWTCVASPAPARALPGEPHDPGQAGRAEVPGDAGADDAVEPTPVSPSILARLAENPFAGIVRVPIATQTLFNLGPNDRTGNVLGVAPILPLRFPDGYSLIARLGLTIPTVPNVAADSGSTTGFGDTQLELYFHKKIRGPDDSLFSVGLGPSVSFPTATDDALGTGTWQLGPALGGSVEAGRFVGVLLLKNLWSVAEDEGRAATHRLALETFLFVNLPELWYLVSEPLILANWENSEGNRWTVPLGGGFGRHFFFRSLPNFAFTTRLQAFYNVVRPDNLARGEIAPEWSLRFVFVVFQPNLAVLDW